MDAARLGCEAPLLQKLLLDAAPGYLIGAERGTNTAWMEPALAWATKYLRGAVQAVQPIPPPRGIGIVG